MKAKYIILISVPAMLILYILWFAQSMGGGTLGGTATIELNCAQAEARQQLDTLLTKDPFKIAESDSTKVKWWDRAGYDFLNYVCINLQGRLYMVSIYSEHFTECDLSVRAYYNRAKTSWIYAKDLSRSDKKEAKKAQKYLLKYMDGCN